MRVSSTQFLSWRWILVFWTAIATISATMLYLKLRAGSGAPSFSGIFLVKLITWLFWGALTPVVIFLGRRYNLERGRWIRVLLIHAPLSIFFACLNVLIYAAIVFAISDTGVSFFSTFLGFLFGQFEWHLIIYWAIVIVGYAFEYYGRYKAGEMQSVLLESELTRAQLQALKMQLHPHFLFNTLHNISSLVRQGEQDKAVSMLSGVSELLRTALAEKDQQKIPLRNEIDFIKRYLEIEKVRFNNRLEVEYVYSEQIVNNFVPNFILQPVVENAVNHGLSQKLNARLIRITIYTVEDRLYIKVYNEGPELKHDFDLRSDSGIGLQATMDRLHHMYGDDYTMHLYNEYEGVSVEITIPLQKTS